MIVVPSMLPVVALRLVGDCEVGLEVKILKQDEEELFIEIVVAKELIED